MDHNHIINASHESNSNIEATYNSNSENLIVSESQYLKGETNVQKTLTELVNSHIQKYTNNFLSYLFSVVLGSVAVIIWNLNSKVHELEGKYSSPDKTIETISKRLEELENINQELMRKNFQMEIERIQFEAKNK